jgi:hypothetical protein
MRRMRSRDNSLDDHVRHGVVGSAFAFSTQRAHSAFCSYALLSQRELDAKRASYATLSRANKRLAQKIGYERKLDTSKEIISLNAIVAGGIVELMEEELPSLAVSTRPAADAEDLSRVREAFKHFVRDWSVEGSSERAQIFKPITDVLEAYHWIRGGR